MGYTALKFVWFISSIVLISPFWASAHVDGDALQLVSFRAAAADTPDVSDGRIAPSGQVSNWGAASVRVMSLVNNNDTIPFTVLFTHTNDFLYVGAVGYMTNSSAQQTFRIYFDQDDDGLLDGSAASPGEYYVQIKANGGAPVDGHWNGSTWQENATKAAGLSGQAHRHGSVPSSSYHLFNWELKIPLNPNAEAGNSYLSLSPGEEPGLFFEILTNSGSSYFWNLSNLSKENPSGDGWGEILIPEAQVAARAVSSLRAKGIIPTIDGNISDDPNWRFAFQKTITFTDYGGNKLPNSILYMKETAAGNLIIGVRVTTNPTNTGDYLQVYFDQGDAGGDLNYVLNGSGITQKDDAVRIEGDTTYTDYYFNGSAWVSDGAGDQHGGGKVHPVAGLAWEYEISRSLNSGDTKDIKLVSTDALGLLLRFHNADNNRDYWWSSTINSETIQMDPVLGDFTAMGWSKVSTGGPFVQPLYPEQNDILSGTFPLMLYAEDEDGIANVTDVDYRITDLNDNVVMDYASGTVMTKVNNSLSGIWVSTFNTNTASTPDGDYNIVFRALDNEDIYVYSPVRVSIQNTGVVGGPTVSNPSLSTGDVVSGSYSLTFDVSPKPNNKLDTNLIEISIDGKAWTRVDSTPAVTGGTGKHVFNSLDLSDGAHTVRVRAQDVQDAYWGYSELVIFNVKNESNLAAIVITSPADGAVQSDSVTLVYQITTPANASIDSVQVTVDGVNWARTNSNSTVKIPTGNLPDGAHLVRVRAFGNNRTVGYSNPITLVTNNKPVVTLTGPGGGATVSGDVRIAFTSVSPANISHADSLYLDGKNIGASESDTAHTLSMASLSDGAHTIQIRTTDANGKVGKSAAVNVMVKNSPSVSLDAPKGDSLLSGTLGLTFSASAVLPATVDSVQLAVDGGAWRKTKTNSLDTLDTEALSDGRHLLQLRVFDSHGRTGLSAVVIITIRNSPTVTVSHPEGGDTVSAGLTVRFRAVPVSPASLSVTQISLDGKAFGSTTTDSSHTINTIALADGSHSLIVRVTDSNGKSGQSARVLFITRNLPVVALLAPVADSTVSGTLEMGFGVTLTSDKDSVTAVHYSMDGSNWKETQSDSTHTLDTREFTDGPHNIQVRAVNNNGKTGYSPIVKFRIQNHPAVAITAPRVDSVIKGTVRIAFTPVPVAPDTIQTTQISAGGGEWTATTTDSTHDLDTRAFADGNLQIQMRAIDGSGKTGLSFIREFVVDNSAPKIWLPQIRYPQGNRTGRKGVAIMATATAMDAVAGLDADSGVVFLSDGLDTAKVVEILYDDGPEGGHGDKVKGDNVFTALVRVNTDSTGSIAFGLRARDGVGNDTTIVSAVVLDNTPPSVSYTVAPEPKGGESTISGEVYADKVLMKGRASDVGSGLDVVRISVRNGEGEHVNNSPMEVKPDSGEFSRILNLVPGQNVITLLAVDKAGNPDSLQGELTYILPKVTQLAVPGKKTEVASPNRSKVVIPADALHHAEEVTMRVVDRDEEPKPLNDDIRLLGLPHEFGPDGTVFRKPVTITLAYNDLDLDPDQDLTPDYAPEDLVIYFWDGSSWLQAGVPSVDEEARTVSVSVNHFTLYDIGVDTSGGAAGSDEFIAYWKHNPVKKKEGSTFVINVPREGTLSMSIYDMAGDLVNRLLPEQGIGRGNLSPMWDGDNVNGTFAGAGLYIYVLKYESSDGSIKELIRKPVGLMKE